MQLRKPIWRYYQTRFSSQPGKKILPEWQDHFCPSWLIFRKTGEAAAPPPGPYAYAHQSTFLQAMAGIAIMHESYLKELREICYLMQQPLYSLRISTTAKFVPSLQFMHVVMSLYWCNFLIFGSIKTKLSLNSLEGSNEPLYFLDYDKKFSNISRNFIEPTSFAFVRSSWGRHTIESWAIFQGVPLQAAQNIAKFLVVI